LARLAPPKEKAMGLSVNANASALVALQNLNATNRALDTSQNRINTGLKVAGAKDNSSVYAIAQNARGDVGALNAVKQSVQRAMSIVDVSIAAGESVSNLLVEMKQKALAASDTSLDDLSRQALNEDFLALLDQIQTVIDNSTFNGANLLDGSLAGGFAVLADADASNPIMVLGEDLSVGGATITLPATADLLTPANTAAALAALVESIQNTNATLARLGVTGKKLEQHLVFVGKFQDALNVAIGNMVDADLAAESASLQALQVKQQLGVQALAIANERPQLVLTLLKG
jgi:flagellin